jgi:hypothetical protein
MSALINENCVLLWLDKTVKLCKKFHKRCTTLGKFTLFSVYVVAHALTAISYLILIGTVLMFDVLISLPVTINIMNAFELAYGNVKKLFIIK